MAAKQTTTKVIVTRTKTPKSTKASSKRGNQHRCTKCGRFM